MKTLRLIGKGALCVLIASIMASCDDDDEGVDDVVFNMSNYAVEYDNNDAWAEVYNVNVGDLVLGDFTFSHNASGFEWDGVTYYSYTGFCPSRSSDNLDHSGEDWIAYQWGAITGGGLAGTGTPYMLACWSTSEDVVSVPEVPSLAVVYKNGAVFDPDEVYVTNSAYGYYGMKNGTYYSKVFGADDWCKLHIVGALNGVETGRVEVLLADGTNILNTWKEVDLDALGESVDMIYFQMTSSDSGQYGMNNPAYFCLDRLKIELLN